MKISGLEKGILALTAAFLLLTVGYFLGQRGGEPYSVSTQTLWTGEESAQTQEEPQTAQVNINTADAEELQALTGIGRTRAEAIVADREANGPFRNPQEITRVPGIGQGTLEEIMDNITVE